MARAAKGSGRRVTLASVVRRRAGSIGGVPQRIGSVLPGGEPHVTTTTVFGAKPIEDSGVTVLLLAGRPLVASWLDPATTVATPTLLAIAVGVALVALAGFLWLAQLGRHRSRV